MIIFIDTRRLLPEETFAPRLSRLTTDEALVKAHRVIGECFWPLDVRYQKVVDVIAQLRAWNGNEAARQFLTLDAPCQFFLRFVLETHGLHLQMRRVDSWSFKT